MSAQNTPEPAQDDEQDELSAWHAELSQVTPLAQRPRAKRPPSGGYVRGLRERRQQESQDVMHEAMYGELQPEDFNTGDEQEFRRHSLPRSTLRKLRRGQFTIQSTLDVHGMRREEAHHATQRFLDNARAHDWRCVKIIHGKGLHSPQGIPVLKHRVDITLQHNNDVLAYCSAPNWAGGHGATLILLKRSGRP
ncbi:MAG: Smr/MutS family protein [Oceanococcus sp.]